jgi:hypothetical protein
MASRTAAGRTFRSHTLFVLALFAAFSLLLSAGPVRAQDSCGVAAGTFQIDGRFYSTGGLTDWIQGLSGQGVFDASGNPVLLPALHDRDAEWAGNAVDPDAFTSTKDKNNDDISPSGSPWNWGPGSGPSKNDITDVLASAKMIEGDIWLFLGACTRATNGASHIDFEFNQQGFTKLGTTSGTIVGNGPDAGRTAGVDFIVSVDFEGGGDIPVATFRTWQAIPGGFAYLEVPPVANAVYVCTNDATIPAPPWGAISPKGDETDQVIPYQFVEIALNLSALQIDPSVFCTDVSTILFKTRSAPSFTSELKDLALYPFSIIPPPDCSIAADRNPLCDGESTQLCAPEPPVGADYTYHWDGPGAPFPDARCITATQDGTYSLWISDNFSGCSGDTCTLDLEVVPVPGCAITPDDVEICAGETTQFCGPEAPAGRTYSYAWSGPGGSYPDARCITVGDQGTYELTVTDVGSGCASGTCRQDLTVHPLPPSTITGPAGICEGDTARLCGPEGDYRYAWSGPGGPSGDRCIEAALPGTYYLTVTDTLTGCASQPGEHVLTVVDNPTCSIDGPATVCPDSTVRLCGPEGEFTYAWEGPFGPVGTTRCVWVGDPGTYTLTLHNGSGCESVCEHTLGLDENTAAGEIDDLFICAGERAEFCVTATGTGPIVYQWAKGGVPITGATDSCYVIPAIEAGDVGTYSVTVRGKCGPPLTRSATLTLADVTVAPLRDLYMCEGQTIRWCPEISGRGPFTFTWKKDGEIIPGATDSCLTIVDAGLDDEGTYSVTVAGFCGDPVTVTAIALVGTCEEFCGLTQGFYGNAGGKWTGETTLQLLDRLITPADPLVVGVLGTASVTFPEGTEHCLIELLPGGGPSRTLKSGDTVVDSITCDTNPKLADHLGRIKNILLAQTITLSLNTRLNPDLEDLGLCEALIVIPALPGPDGERGTGDDVPDNEHPRFLTIDPTVLDALDALGLNRDVAGLLILANRALASDLPAGVSVDLDVLEHAVGGINDLTDDCVLLIHCGTSTEPGSGASPSAISIDPGILGNKETTGFDGAGGPEPGLTFALLGVRPNPVRGAGRIAFELPEASRVRFEVFDIAGRRAFEAPEATYGAGAHAIPLNLDRAGLAGGIYFVRMQAVGSDSGTRFRQTVKVLLVR